MTKTVEIALGGTLTLAMREVGQGACFVTLTFGNFTVKARGDEMAYTLPVDKQVLMQVSYEDANGNPAVVDGDVVWASSDEAIAFVIPNTDNTSEATVRPGGTLGQVQISATADADLGEGTRQIVILGDVTIVGGEAVGGYITPVGDPTPIGQPKE
jgi:hypothetical protein